MLGGRCSQPRLSVMASIARSRRRQAPNVTPLPPLPPQNCASESVFCSSIVVAAGGIADGRGLAAALVLGASGVLVGTRFYAATEAAGADAAKERIRNANGDATLRSIVFDICRRNVWPAPFTGRCLRNQHLDTWYGREVELLRNLDSESAKYAAARNDANFDTAAVIAGEAVGLIHEISPSLEIVEGMVRDAATLLKHGASHVHVEG
jgi:nitronate monooxygenase